MEWRLKKAEVSLKFYFPIVKISLPEVLKKFSQGQNFAHGSNIRVKPFLKIFNNFNLKNIKLNKNI